MGKQLIKKVSRCRITGDSLGDPVFTLGMMPLPNAFISEKQLSEPEPFFPLDVHLCEKSGLAQLGHVIDPEAMFSHYAFFTGTSGPSVSHFAQVSDLIATKYSQEGDVVVEIGCNDGTLTGQLAEKKVRAIGVDGALNCVQEAKKRYPKASFVERFFDQNVADLLKKENGEVQVVVACNVVAHIDDVNHLFSAVSSMLSKNGVFIIEVPSLETLVEGLAYDTIYHEHLSYFSVFAFEVLAQKHGLFVDEIHKIPRHAGSIRVFLRRKEQGESSHRQDVLQMIEKERDSGCATKKAWKDFSQRAVQHRASMLQLLQSVSEGKGKIVGYGAPAKATVLLNYCRIGSDLMEFCTDTTPEKIGKYIPGTRIPVVSVDQVHKDPNRVALMHCWNYQDAVLQNEKAWMDQGGHFILPFPSPKLI